MFGIEINYLLKIGLVFIEFINCHWNLRHDNDGVVSEFGSKACFGILQYRLTKVCDI